MLYKNGSAEKKLIGSFNLQTVGKIYKVGEKSFQNYVWIYLHYVSLSFTLIY